VVAFNLTRQSQVETGEAPDADAGAFDSNTIVLDTSDDLSNQLTQQQMDELRGDMEENSDSPIDIQVQELRDAEKILAIRDFYASGRDPTGPDKWNDFRQKITPERLDRVDNYDTVFDHERLEPFKREMYDQTMARLRTGDPDAIAAVASEILAYRDDKLLFASSLRIKTGQTDFFPVQGEDEFVARLADELMSYDGEKGENDLRAERARQAVLESVSPAAEEEANSSLEAVQELDAAIGRERAEEILREVYRRWVAPMATNPAGQETLEMEPETMASDQIPGIIKHNLADEVKSNKEADCESCKRDRMQKQASASQHFGAEYVMYGPSEKRICPKLTGKQMGDIVSESTCRYHCLDGIVIDDNKVVCGQAIFRAHLMDKFSRDFVDADGNLVGGYLNKRFEQNRQVPEENKMRLKPGETRKPRPASWGSTEARMQAMREAEGEKRGYRPTTDTTPPFNYNRDYDRNNVEVPKAPAENRPRKAAFNLSEVTKTAQIDDGPTTRTGFESEGKEVKCPNCGQSQWAADCCVDDDGRFADFQCKRCRKKWSQPSPDAPTGRPGLSSFVSGGEPDKTAQFDDEPGEDVKMVECPGCGSVQSAAEAELGGLGNLMHYRCRYCGVDFSHPSRKKRKEMPVMASQEESECEDSKKKI